MYSNILIATDGSQLSRKAITHGITLAKALNARITVVTVSSPFYGDMMGQASLHLPEMEQLAFKYAEEHLEEVGRIASSANVACETVHVSGKLPYEGIINTAATKGCDLIVMASHGCAVSKHSCLAAKRRKCLHTARSPFSYTADRTSRQVMKGTTHAENESSNLRRARSHRSR